MLNQPTNTEHFYCSVVPNYTFQISEMTNLMQLIAKLQLTVTSNNESVAAEINTLDAKIESNDNDIEENSAKISSNAKNISANLDNISVINIEVDNLINLLNSTADISTISDDIANLKVRRKF